MLPCPVLETCWGRQSPYKSDRTHHLTVRDGLRKILHDVTKVGELPEDGARSFSDAAAHVYHQASFGQCLPRKAYYQRGQIETPSEQ
jgi:hypothetical protein